MKNTKLSLALMSCGLISASAIAADVPGLSSTSKSSASASGNAVLNVSGQTITDKAGQQVGKLQHVILNNSGCIDLAAISLQQGKVVAVPWQLVSFQSGSGGAVGTTAGAASGQMNFVVQVDQAKLQQAPTFNVSHSQTSQQNIQQVYQYFGVQQSTAAGATGSSSTSTPGSSQSTDNSSGSGSTSNSSSSTTGGSQDSSTSGSSSSTSGSGLGTSSGSSTNSSSSGIGSGAQGGTSGSGSGSTGGTSGPSDGQGKDLPPGLEKRDTLPPGLEKRDTLPPGLEKRGSGNSSSSGAQGGTGNSSGHVEDKGGKIK